MSDIKVDEITDAAGTGAPDFPQGFTTSGGAGRFSRVRYKASSGTLTNNVAIAFTIEKQAANFTIGTWSNTAGVITIPTTGLYRFNFTLGRSSAFNENLTWELLTDGVASNDDRFCQMGTAVFSASASLSKYLTAGQTVQVKYGGAGNSFDANLSTFEIIGFE